MKKHLLSLLCFGLLLLSSIISKAQSQEYYVVVGAFAQENNAKKFTGFVKRKFFQASYELNQQRKLYYVYAWKGTDRAEVVNLAKTLQKQPEFFDCWVFAKPILINIQVVEESPPVVIEEPPQEIPKEAQPEPVSETQPVVKQPQVDSAQVTEYADAGVDTVAAEPQVDEVPRVVKGKLFKFEVKTSDGSPIVAKVHHVNTKLGRDIAVYASGNYVDLPSPGTVKEMTLVCGIFGYKEITRTVNYTNPAAKQKDVALDPKGAWVVPFNLERLKTGDFSIMYDVSFFKNSVAMQEKSKADLEILLNMMKDNPRLKIRIHGHANGTKERVITNLREEKSYFTPESSTKSKATATELSMLRAQALKSYLMDNGIEESRLDVKAIGGKGMIVSETHPAAHLNDRIEIQILKD